VSSYGLHNGMFVARFITGPSSLLLRLAVADERTDSPDVILLRPDPLYGNLAESEARACVLTGTDEANREFGTAHHPVAAEYVADNDGGGRLLRRVAWAIVKRLAERGRVGFSGRSETRLTRAEATA
jgi:hypothetical protein